MRALLARWNALRRNERRAAAGVAATLAIALGVAALFERDTRVALFATPLRGEQVSEVVERLAQWNAAFVVTSDNVRVDAAKRNELLLRLALVGVPHAHLERSADALAKAGPLTPQSVLDAQRIEGLAGDLAAGLRSVAGVEDAQVIIAPASDSAFADEATRAATASVRLRLAPGASLGTGELEGVRSFVASAVPGLDPKRVAVLDDRGTSLGSDTAAAPDEAQGLQQSLQSALDLALGAGAAIVRVRVSYDPRTRELHDVVRKPIGSRAIGTSTVDERYKSASNSTPRRRVPSIAAASWKTIASRRRRAASNASPSRLPSMRPGTSTSRRSDRSRKPRWASNPGAATSCRSRKWPFRTTPRGTTLASSPCSASRRR